MEVSQSIPQVSHQVNLVFSLKVDQHHNLRDSQLVNRQENPLEDRQDNLQASRQVSLVFQQVNHL